MKFELWMPCAIVVSFALGMVLQSARGSSAANDAIKVTGVGGFFIKAQSPGKLAEWYRTHLGIALQAAGQGEHAMQYHPFDWREKDHPDTIGATVFSIFPAEPNISAPRLALHAEFSRRASRTIARAAQARRHRGQRQNRRRRLQRKVRLGHGPRRPSHRTLGT